MQVVLDTRGLHLSVRNACFLIEAGDETRIIHPQRVSSFLVTAPCRLSSPALVLAAENQIPLTICNRQGRPEARIWSPRFINTSLLRRMQHRFCEDPEGMEWAAKIIRSKIEGQQHNLLFIGQRFPSISEETGVAIAKIEQSLASFVMPGQAGTASCKKQLMSLEAYAASLYWQLLGIKLPEPFTFSGRVKCKPADAFNSCINYLYGILRNQVETAVLSYGLDPALGIMHRDGYCMPSLVFDLMEPFRPVMDRLLLTAITGHKLPAEMTETSDGRVSITKAGRRRLIELFSQKLHARTTLNATQASLNTLILSEVKQLADAIKKSKTTKPGPFT